MRRVRKNKMTETGKEPETLEEWREACNRVVVKHGKLYDENTRLRYRVQELEKGLGETLTFMRETVMPCMSRTDEIYTMLIWVTASVLTEGAEQP